MKFPRLSPFSRATPEGNLTRAHQAANTSCSPELAHPPKGKNYCPLGPASYAYHLPSCPEWGITLAAVRRINISLFAEIFVPYAGQFLLILGLFFLSQIFPDLFDYFGRLLPLWRGLLFLFGLFHFSSRP